MKKFIAVMMALVSIAGAWAQVGVKIVPEKKIFLSGEGQIMCLTITNNTGAVLKLKSEPYYSWLDIHVKKSAGQEELPQSRFALFPTLEIPPGMSVSRKIDLRHFYDISSEGNYHVQAVVKMPNKVHMFASPEKMFSVRTGNPMWTQTAAITGSMKRCRFATCLITVKGVQKLYVQTSDPDTGVAYNAVCIGDWMGTFRPECVVDSKTTLHVLFPTTPILCAYACVDFRGKLVKLRYYKRHVGKPSLVFFPDGQTRVVGATEYDPTPKGEKLPDASVVPGM